MTGAITVAAPPAPPGLYAVQPARTAVVFHLRLLGMFPVAGAFADASGELRLDLQHPQAILLSVRVKVAAVHASSRFFADQLRSARWLDAAAYPDMRFVSHSISFTAPGQALVRGELTLHGVTRELTLHATFRDSGDDPVTRRYRLDFVAEAGLRRSDFGMKALLPVLSNDVRLTMQAEFEKE